METVGFGYNIGWLALRCDDPRAVAAACDVEEPQSCPWNEGIKTAYRQRAQLFITPPVDGWVLVVPYFDQRAYAQPPALALSTAWH
jgi:hypothetical protein